MGMGMDGNGNDSMGVGREWEQESHFRTPLPRSDAGSQAFGDVRLHRCYVLRATHGIDCRLTQLFARSAVSLNRHLKAFRCHL